MFKLRKVQVARAAAVVVSLALVFTAGCSRDPNVRKQKYLESGKRYEASRQVQRGRRAVPQCAEGGQELRRRALRDGQDVSEDEHSDAGLHGADEDGAGEPGERAGAHRSGEPAAGWTRHRPRGGAGQRGAGDRPERRGRLCVAGRRGAAQGQQRGCTQADPAGLAARSQPGQLPYGGGAVADGRPGERGLGRRRAGQGGIAGPQGRNAASCAGGADGEEGRSAGRGAAVHGGRRDCAGQPAGARRAGRALLPRGQQGQGGADAASGGGRSARERRGRDAAARLLRQDAAVGPRRGRLCGA